MAEMLADAKYIFSPHHHQAIVENVPLNWSQYHDSGCPIL
jgi:hypothetical protein